MTTPPKKAARCPICGKDRIEAWRPFCSARCKDVDLHRWFAGSYAIPVVEHDDPDETSGT